MSHTKHGMDSAKGSTDSGNTGGHGVDVKASDMKQSCIPLLAENNIVRFHDLGAAAA
jgi:hypothetical protein